MASPAKGRYRPSSAAEAYRTVLRCRRATFRNRAGKNISRHRRRAISSFLLRRNGSAVRIVLVNTTPQNRAAPSSGPALLSHRLHRNSTPEPTISSRPAADVRRADRPPSGPNIRLARLEPSSLPTLEAVRIERSSAAVLRPGGESSKTLPQCTSQDPTPPSFVVV